MPSIFSKKETLKKKMLDRLAKLQGVRQATDAHKSKRDRNVWNKVMIPCLYRVQHLID